MSNLSTTKRYHDKQAERLPAIAWQAEDEYAVDIHKKALFRSRKEAKFAFSRVEARQEEDILQQGMRRTVGGWLARAVWKL